MFRQIVLAVTATAVLSAAVLVPTTASAYPIGPVHRGFGPAGGVIAPASPITRAGPLGVITRIGNLYWTCRHSWSGRAYDCQWVQRGGGFVSGGR
jgi:hypothetical protein